jgi:predicted dehydrogenase
MERTSVGIIGCGNISKIYCESGRKFNNLKIAACADIDLSRARAKAAEHEIPKALSVPEILADPEVEIILNLTIPAVHADISRQALEHGKHVYSEKPLAVSREDGSELLALANSKGLRVGCAPDTFLGSGLQTCRKLIDEGVIGEPIGAAGWMLSHGPEGWHPDPEFFYQPGAGPMFDMGPYYLTAMTSLLGPVQRLTGSARISFPERLITSQAKYGQKITVRTATHIAGILDFASGAIGTLVTSFDVHGSTVPFIEIYGSEGSLSVPDPNTFGGPVKIRLAGEKVFNEVPLAFPYSENSRGIGLADMAAAISAGRGHRANGEMASHVLDMIVGFHDASLGNGHIQLNTTMQRPEPLPLGLNPGEVELPV